MNRDEDEEEGMVDVRAVGQMRRAVALKEMEGGLIASIDIESAPLLLRNAFT
ncbi:hypothetical protein Syun_028035 [Stephania yunnanensis]|uniref:Uncharacterized protein n=1 Tax=Stephania yunnanensis TaxID=152371 RepID=A0AAP0EH07_9MAGN